MSQRDVHAEDDERTLRHIFQILAHEAKLTLGEAPLVTTGTLGEDVIKNNEVDATFIEGIHVGTEHLIIAACLSPADGVGIAVVVTKNGPRLLRQLLHQRTQVAVKFQVVVDQITEE